MHLKRKPVLIGFKLILNMTDQCGLDLKCLMKARSLSTLLAFQKLEFSVDKKACRGYSKKRYKTEILISKSSALLLTDQWNQILFEVKTT